jgi:hypothetical protein
MCYIIIPTSILYYYTIMSTINDYQIFPIVWSLIPKIQKKTKKRQKVGRDGAILARIIYCNMHVDRSKIL